MTAKRLGIIIPTLILLAGASPPRPLILPTDPPTLLEDGYGYLDLLSETEYRESMKKYLDDAGFVPLDSEPSGLSGKARFDAAIVLDHTVTMAVEGDSERGYSFYLDLNANGRLTDDPAWPMKKRTLTLWDFDGTRELKEADVGEVITTLETQMGGEKATVPFRMAVAITGDLVRIPGDETPRRQALSTQSTLRQGVIRLSGINVAFALRGEGGIYNDDFNCVVFDLNRDGKLDSADRTSQEYYWVWERRVKLAEVGYDFQVDRFGRSLALTPLANKISDRASLEVGQPAPDFAFTDLNGKKHRLKDYRGKVVLLDFWGTWCPGCVVHASQLSSAYETLHEKGLEILGIHGGGNAEEVRKFTAQHGMGWSETLETGSMPEGRPIQKLYRIFGVPNYFLIDRKGRIVMSGEHKPLPLLRTAERLLTAEP